MQLHLELLRLEERRKLLDDMALEVNEHEEKPWNERNKRTELNEWRFVSGEEMRQDAATRRKTGEKHVVHLDAGGDIAPQKKICKAVQPACSDEDEVSVIVEQMRERLEVKLKRLEMEQRR